MIYHDPSGGPAPLVIRIDAFDRAAPVLNRLGDALDALAAAFDPKRRVLDELVPLVRTAAALDGGYRSPPKRIQLPAGRPAGLNPVWFEDGATQSFVFTGWQRQILEQLYVDLLPSEFRRLFLDQVVTPLATSIRCPACGRESHNPNDVRLRYCGACHEFHDRMDLGGSP